MITEKPTLEEHNFAKVTYYETSELAERFARQELQAKKHNFVSSAGLTQSAATQTGVLELMDKLGDPALEPSTTPKEITREDLHSTHGIEKIFKAGDKVLQVVNTTLLVHNAMMLSSNLTQTMGEATSMALQAVGIRDHENEVIDVNQLVKGKINAIFTSYSRT